MDKVLGKIVEWIEYFKNKDDVVDKRLENIENYLTNMSSKETDSKLDTLMERLEKLEKIGVEENDRELDKID